MLTQQLFINHCYAGTWGEQTQEVMLTFKFRTT